MKKPKTHRFNAPLIIIVPVAAVLSLMSCDYFYDECVGVFSVFLLPLVLAASLPIALIAALLIPKTGWRGHILIAVLLWTIAAFSWQGVHLWRVHRCVSAAKREFYIPESATDVRIRRPQRYAAYHAYVDFVDSRPVEMQISEFMDHYLRRGWIVAGETSYDTGRRFHLTHPNNNKLEILIIWPGAKVSMCLRRDAHGSRGFAWM